MMLLVPWATTKQTEEKAKACLFLKRRETLLSQIESKNGF